MTAVQMPLGGPKHINKGLFSDHYLNEIVTKQGEWLSMQNEARPVLEALRTRWAEIRLDELDESQIEDRWIKYVFEQLGLHYSVQVKIRYRDTGYRKPDYGLTQTAEQAHAITNQIYSPEELQQLGLLAIADAKKWGVSFDQAAPEQRNPSQQIDEYLRYSELPWGILTDGQYWRLYERDTSKNNVYYAVDLKTVLDSNDLEAFIYFYAFFRQQAFTGGWLEQVKQGSEEYAQGISERLEEQVFEALEFIAQGFLEYRGNKLEPTPETLQTIYDQSLILLYRLLFILYAESREILPLQRNTSYAINHSLESIKKEIDKTGTRYATKSAYYARLNDLFYSIDQGDKAFRLPAYNGRLFSIEEHPFLGSKAVGDSYLMQALDQLSRVPTKDPLKPREFVDYRDLEVRHLGAIYEKLLEYQLDYTTEALTLKDGKYAPARNGDEAEVDANHVYLRTGSNERKITGSYYTPDYIVRFIVERTLEPLLTDITHRYATLETTPDSGTHWAVHDKDGLRNAILALNVLDPATGSGHFMVEATAYIAEWLRGLGLVPDDLAPGEDELIYWKRQVVNNCIYGVDLNPLAVELAKLSLWLATLAEGKPLTYLDHHVKCGNSLVGARASEIGVNVVDPAAERRSRERNEPGDPQMSLFEDEEFAPAVSFAVGRMAEIEQTRARNVADVKQQEQLYAGLREELAAWKEVADVWVARYFGLNLDQKQWEAVRTYLINRTVSNQSPYPPTPSPREEGKGRSHADNPSLFTGEGLSLGYKGGVGDVLKSAEAITAQQRFLHWDLEFPEVFYQPDGKALENPGFDVVLGNPPYVRQERIQPIKPYLATKYEIYQGTADLFLYFYERGLKLLKQDQRLGYITSGTYMNSNSASAFRHYIHESAAFESAVNFGENQPFKGAEMVYPTIAVLRKGEPAETFRSLFIEGTRIPESIEEALDQLGIDCLSDVTGMDEWKFQPAELTDLFRKLITGYQPLKQVFGNKIFAGIKTGLNDAFIIDYDTRQLLIQEHPSSAELIKPLVRGEDIRPWYTIDSEQYLIFTQQGIKIENYPAIERYLNQFRSNLEPKPDRWNDNKQGKWVGRKAGPYAWYEIQDPVLYQEEFGKPKILLAKFIKLPRFSWDVSGAFVLNTAHFLVDDSESTLSLLNSRVTWFVLSQVCVPLRLRAGLWQYVVIPQFLDRIPIPDLTADQESVLAEMAETITAKARDRYQMHEAMRGRIAADLGQGGKLNEKLEQWWSLNDGSALRTEVKKAFKTDIALSERDEWGRYLAAQKVKHQHMTGEIVALETRMNAIVYAAFKLTPDEIGLIETATKYPYGEV